MSNINEIPEGVGSLWIYLPPVIGGLGKCYSYIETMRSFCKRFEQRHIGPAGRPFVAFSVLEVEAVTRNQRRVYDEIDLHLVEIFIEDFPG